jgi:hypothetical protein
VATRTLYVVSRTRKEAKSDAEKVVLALKDDYFLQQLHALGSY